MRIPNIHEDYVRLFCLHVVPGGEPLYVLVNALLNKPINECFSIVPEHVARYGGKQLIGWIISEWKKVLIEAEFHAVWQNTGGAMIDLTPKSIPVSKILFLPDPSREYTGVSVDNIRKPLRNDKRIKRFCDLWHEHFLELNKGDLANQYGLVVPPPDVAHRLRQIENEVLQLQRELTEIFGEP